MRIHIDSLRQHFDNNFFQEDVKTTPEKLSYLYSLMCKSRIPSQNSDLGYANQHASSLSQFQMNKDPWSRRTNNLANQNPIYSDSINCVKSATPSLTHLTDTHRRTIPIQFSNQNQNKKTRVTILNKKRQKSLQVIDAKNQTQNHTK